MALLDIVLYPDPRLREVCEPVEDIDEEVIQLLSDMAETMYNAPGIGLAASQVGVLRRAIVVDVGFNDETGEKGHLYKIINPEIVESEGKSENEEGCLSLPGVRDYVKRPENVTVVGKNELGEEIEISAAGLLSICLQHEIDHLNGVLFIDHLSRLKRELIKSKLKKIGT